jgi:NTE family protein
MKIGLALSGGGVRGIAHIGALKALEEHRLVPSQIAGTSAGAIVGGLYASGCSPEKVLDFFKTVNPFSITNYAVNKPGFVNTEKLHTFFKEFLPNDSFGSLKIPLSVTATNVLDGSLKIFTEGPLINAILASAAFPGIFTPVKIEDTYYVDGGTLNNFPVDLVKKDNDTVIGVYVNPFEKITIKELKYFYNVVERAFQIRSANDSQAKFDLCDLLICPEDLGSYSTFSLKEMDKIFQLGYMATKKAIQSEKGNLLLT